MKEVKLMSSDIKLIKALVDNLPIGLRVNTIVKITNLKIRGVYKRLNILRKYGIIEHSYPLWNINIKKLKGYRKIEEGIEYFINLVDSNIKKIHSKRCYFCNYNRVIDLHHIKQRKNGGKNLIDNIMPLCPNCHQFLHRHDYQLIKLKGEYFMVDKEKNIVSIKWKDKYTYIRKIRGKVAK